MKEFGIALIFLGLIIMTLNLMVLRVYQKTKSLRVPKNYFIVALATADILTVIFSIVPYATYMIKGDWYGGHTWCVLWLMLDHLMMSAANLTVVAIAVDRYFAICRPLYHRAKFNAKAIKIAIALVWIVAALTWIPAIFNHQTRTTTDTCEVEFYRVNNLLKTIIVTFFSYIAPAVTLSILYTIISMTVNNRRIMKQKVQHSGLTTNQPVEMQKHHSKEIITEDDEQGSSISQSSTKDDREGNDEKQNSNHNKPQRMSTNRKHDSHKRAIRLLLLISIAFVMSWMPYHATIIVKASKIGHKIPSVWWKVCYATGWMNTLLNPICYAFGNHRFARGFKSIFTCKKHHG